MSKTNTQELLSQVIHSKEDIGLWQQVRLTLLLSLPAILAQLSAIVMEYIDASMVGSLGAAASASIGLVTTSMWLIDGLCIAVSTGFSVQVAHLIGANKTEEANKVFHQGLLAATIFSIAVMIIGLGIADSLPVWLGGGEEIRENATIYFLMIALTTPIYQVFVIIVAMLRCCGNMKVPSIVSLIICLLDVVFNFFLIFPTRQIHLFGMDFTCPGMGLEVLGAAIGTGVAWTIGMLYLIYFMWRRSDLLRLRFRQKWNLEKRILKRALVIGMPIGVERTITCAAYIMSTIIVAPLGTIAIAANAFGITIEGFCYMPGFGIADAATTLVGQSIGAKRDDLTRRFSYITVVMGVAVMSVLAVAMYVFSPALMTMMTPDTAVQSLTVSVLRIEAFAEPLFAAAIVCYGIFVGTGHTLVPSSIQLFCIWAIRITLAAHLATTMGLRGVWIAMAIELCIRGLILLIRLIIKLHKAKI